MGDARALELGAVVGVRVVEADDAGHAEVVQDGRVVLGEEGHLVGMLVLAAGLQRAFESDELWADLLHVAVHRVVKPEKLVNELRRLNQPSLTALESPLSATGSLGPSLNYWCRKSPALTHPLHKADIESAIFSTSARSYITQAQHLQLLLAQLPPASTICPVPRLNIPRHSPVYLVPGLAHNPEPILAKQPHHHPRRQPCQVLFL